jgi:hypothetical protein
MHSIKASQADMEEELLALAEAMDDSPPDANGMAPPPGPLHVSSTQACTMTVLLPSDAEVGSATHGTIAVTLLHLWIVIELL